MKKISKETHFIFYPSKAFHEVTMSIPKADEETEKQVLQLINGNTITVMGGMYLANLPGKELKPIHIGYQFWDKTAREITNIQRVFNATILVTHKEVEALPL